MSFRPEKMTGGISDPAARRRARREAWGERLAGLLFLAAGLALWLVLP